MTWHTKNSSPLLVPQVEAIVHHYLRDKCISTPGAYVHTIGGIETHVHLVVSIPPTLTISEWIGQLKGGSSHDANQRMGSKLLEWQGGYGVVSFGTKDMPWVINYVKNQREHHANGTWVDRLEQIGPKEPKAQADEHQEAP